MIAASSLEALRVNPEWASLPLFDRSNWTRVRFGDVVENVNETEADPAAAGIDRYIGLEHLEPGSLHVTSWGNVSDGTTFTRRCRPGQVLFGKRRAYQRKVAVAEFDAVVSGDIYVLAPKDDRLLPELLPFICLSERFFQHAVGTSAGSLSPRTNWSSLASFEFDLPPLTQQNQVFALLSAAEDSVSKASISLERWATLKRRALDELTNGWPKPFTKKKLGTAATFQYGLSAPLSTTGLFPVLRMMNFDEELVAPNDLKYLSADSEAAKPYILASRDILFNRTNSYDLVGKTGLFGLEGTYLFASYLVRITTDASIVLPEFVNYYLNSDSGQREIRAFATPGVSQTNISAGNLKKLEIPCPEVTVQRAIVERLDDVAVSKRTARAHLGALSAALSRLVDLATG